MKKFFTLFTLFVMFAICLIPSYLSADEIDPDLLPSMIGASNSGTLFYLTFHPTLEEGVHGGSGIRIYVSSMYATTVTLEIAGIGKYIQKTTYPYGVIEFFLSPADAQMYYKVYEAPRPEQVWKGRAIKISSDDPIICYGVARFLATSDGYMALPVSSLGNEYQVASSPNAFSTWDHDLSSFTSVVAAFDDTKVLFRMGGTETSNALKEDGTYLSPNQTISRTMNEGDVWLIPGIGPYSDLTGSNITSDKPVAVFSGNQCGQIPTEARACDYMIEQELPVMNWGKTYLVTPIIGRKNYSVVKIFASEPITEVSIDGVPKFTIQTPGGIEGSGFIVTRANTNEEGELTIQPVVITGNKPINVVQYNPSSQDDKAATDNDPFQMQVLPIEQFQTDVIFNTPGTHQQYGFKNNFVNIVYKSTTDGKIPDDMLWGEIVDGAVRFIPMTQFSGSPGLKFDYDDSDGKYYYSKTIKLPYDGVFRIKADAPFAAYAYGNDFFDSYGFPVAGCNYDLTSDEGKVPFVDWQIDDDGNIDANVMDKGGVIGKIDKDGEEVQSTGASGLSIVTMIHALSSNYKFIPSKFIPGTLDPVNFKLEPINPLLPSKAVIALSDRRGNDTVLVLSFIPKSLPSITVEKTQFDLVKSNQQTSLDFTLINDQQSKTEKIKSIILKNSDKQFSIIDNISENTSLNIGESHKFKVTFTGADFHGKNIGDIEKSFMNNIGYELMNGKKYFFQEIAGMVYNPRIDLNDVNFATKLVDEKFKEEFISIKNSGNNTLEIYGFEFPEGTPFKLDLPEASPENPFIVKQLSEHKIKVNFSPESPGEFNATLKVISDAYVIKNESKLYAKAMPSSIQDDELISADINIRKENGAFVFTSDSDYQLNSVEVYDLAGRQVYSSQLNTSLNNYSLSFIGLESGVYIIRMNVNNSIISKKIVI